MVVNACAPLLEFPELWDFYVAFKNNGDTSLTSHTTIANLYVDTIARALQEYQTGTVVPENVQPEQHYKDLAWNGLEETAIIDSLFPLGSDDRIRIYNRNKSENYQQSFNGVSPIGTPCD